MTLVWVVNFFWFLSRRIAWPPPLFFHCVENLCWKGLLLSPLFFDPTNRFAERGACQACRFPLVLRSVSPLIVMIGSLSEMICRNFFALSSLLSFDRRALDEHLPDCWIDPFFKALRCECIFFSRLSFEAGLPSPWHPTRLSPPCRGWTAGAVRSPLTFPVGSVLWFVVTGAETVPLTFGFFS